MAGNVDDIEFTTGPGTLPDVGKLSYNGCTFSPLFATQVSGQIVRDAANRTTKYMEYTITADGYATLPQNDHNINNVMDALREALTAQAGELVYSGRGMDISVNTNDGVDDVAWGPVPELLEFIPLGAGRSAKVKWTVKTRIPEVSPVFSICPFGPVLQFNSETIVSYGEDGFSSLTIRGTLEVPLTRATQDSRTLTSTVDTFRSSFLREISSSIDLTRFRVTRRDINISRDKRTMEWEFVAEEQPYMAMPPDCTLARGTFQFRPAKVGLGLATWLCTLRATYTVRNDRPRRVAWDAFLALVRERMNAARFGNLPANQAGGGAQNPPAPPGGIGAGNVLMAIATGSGLTLYQNLLNQQSAALSAPAGQLKSVMIIDLSGEEGLYLDSKTVTFSVTWRLNNTLSNILLASGFWKKVNGPGDKELWASSVSDISGYRSWLRNKINASADVIVDFGGDS